MKRVSISVIILALVVSSLFIPSIVPAQQQEVEWNFTESSEGWSPTNGVSPFNVINGILSTFITGFDPYIHSPVLDLSAESFYLLEIRIAVNKGTGMSIYWITDRSPQWGEDKRVNFDIIPDGKFH
ncbi:hypothetical protein H5T89_09210, partial [bacterium]|nr:hypothetical protein [bacterium]